MDGHPASRRNRGLRIGLGILLVLMFAGRFVPGPPAWGFNHLAYLPVWFFALWIAAALLAAWPRAQERLTSAMAGPVPRFLFERRSAPWILVPSAGALFALVRERSFFMGDGYLVGELVGRLVKFRTFDALDYLFHVRVYEYLSRHLSWVTSFGVYRTASVLAGMIAVLLYRSLIGRLSWEPWRKAALFLLLFLFGPATLFFGYVESYTWLLLFMNAFLIAGVLVLEERLPLWVASTLYGIALAFHLTSLFCGTAILYLALKAPVRPAWRRWLLAVGPPAFFLGLAAGLHFLAGYNAYWVHKEFFENRNAHSLWIPIRGSYGLFSWYHLKDTFNDLLIMAPVPLVVVLASWRRLYPRLRREPVPFLLSQIVPITLFYFLLDKKLGGARDWDMLAGLSGGLIPLAALLLPRADGGDRLGPSVEPEAIPVPTAPSPALTSNETGIPETSRRPGSKRRRGANADAGAVAAAGRESGRPDPVLGMILAVGLLMTAPWVTLLHMETRSIARFTSVLADFPAFPRAYGYEELGKYYRKGNDMERAEQMYQRCVATYPSNARFRILLGSIYFSRGELDLAEKEYEAGLADDPNNVGLASMGYEMLGKLGLQKKDYGTALDWFQKLVKEDHSVATSWELVGYAATGANRPDLVVDAYRHAMQLDPSLNHWHDLGVALVSLDRPAEAVDAFRQALARGGDDPSTHLGLAGSLALEAHMEAEAGHPVPVAWLEEAYQQTRIVLAAQPGHPGATKLLKNLDELRASLKPTLR